MIDIPIFELEKKAPPIKPIKASTRWHARYPKTLSEYARLYARSVETISGWIKRGKQSGHMPPLENAEELASWYSSHVGSVPDDLLALCLPHAVEERANGAHPINLDDAVIEVRKILSAEIQKLNASGVSDARRSMLLRHIQQTSDSLVRLENCLAAIRRDRRDALPWGVYAAGVNDIMVVFDNIRKARPRRLLAELERQLCVDDSGRVCATKEQVIKAEEKVCGDEISILSGSPAIRPVIEKMLERYRQLEAAAVQEYRDGKTAVPMTFEPVSPAPV